MALNAEQAAKRVDSLYAVLSARRSVVDKRERYFEGEHSLSFMSDEWKKFHRDRYRGFSDNWCEVVGRAAPERTEVYGIRLGDDAEAMSSDEKVLWRDWEVNAGPAQSAQGFLSGAVTDRSYAMVWADSNDEPVLTWEHSGQVAQGEWVDASGRKVTDHLKVWRDGDTEFATLYEPDEVWKYERPSTAASFSSGRTESGLIVPIGFGEGGWQLRGGEQNPMPNPLGVSPLVEYPNRPVLGKGPISDVDGAMAMQDAVNLLWAYMFTAADHASMPARVIMGAEPPKMPVLDENGNKVGEKPLDIDQLKQGRLLWLTGQGTQIGQWDAAKLDVFTGAINVMVKHLASQTRTPIHYIMGELGNVNGETLTATELPLATKVREGHKHLTGPLRETFRRMALVRGDDRVAEACRTAIVQFKNPETASDSQISDAALKDKGVGWSAAGILERRYGMSQPEIERELARREEEGLADPVRQLGRDLMNGTGNAPAGG